MRQIKKWGLARLHTEESFGFLKFVKEAMTSLPVSESDEPDGPSINSLSARSATGASSQLDAAMETFNEKFEQFDSSLKDSDENPASAKAASLDAERDAAWREMNAYASAMTAHPTETIAAASAKVWAIFEKYGNPTSLAQSEESGILHNLLADIEALDSDDKTQSGISPWYDKLAALQASFEEADQERAAIAGARTKGIVKQARQEAETAYRSLAQVVNASVIFNGEAPYSDFIDKVNGQMDRQGQISTRRDTINAKKKEEEEGDDRPTTE